MSQYFPKLYERSGGNINVKMDLSNYPTKADFKEAAGVNTSNLAMKSDLASLTHFFPMFPFDPPLKISENLWFSDVFMGVKRDQKRQ